MGFYTSKKATDAQIIEKNKNNQKYVSLILFENLELTNSLLFHTQHIQLGNFTPRHSLRYELKRKPGKRR